MRIFKNNIKWRSAIIYFGIIGMVLLFSLTVPNFFSATNLVTVLVSMTLICVLSLGVTFVLTIGEIDISIGAAMSVAPCTMVVLSRSGLSIWLSLLIGFVLVLFLGFLNGLLVSRFSMPSFIATLSTQGIAMGYTRIMTGNKPAAMDSQTIKDLFGGELMSIPKMILWMIILILVCYFILHRMQFGKNIHCVGDNKEASKMYGLNVNRYIIASFMCSSLFVFFAGLLDVARTSFAVAGSGETLVLNAIVASVIGGTSLQGGRGTVIGATAGSFFLALLSNALFSLGLMPWVTNIVIGSVIIIILTVSGLIDKRNMEKTVSV